MPTSVLKLLAAAPVAVVTRDAELLSRFVERRDQEAFAELVRRHGPLVYRVCSRIVGRDLAEDAFQAVFLVLACRAERLRKPASVGSWLVGVAGRVAQQLRAREARRAVNGLFEVADLLQSTDTSLLATELSQVLDEELTRLPDELRDAVVLCLLEGRTQDEAAAELGGSVRTLRRRLSRAKAILRFRLERRGVIPAIAAGLVSGALSGAQAVPAELTRATVAEVQELLAGGAARARAAVIAMGVVKTMSITKTAIATACVVVIGLCCIWGAIAQTNSTPQSDPRPRLPDQPTSPTAGSPSSLRLRPDVDKLSATHKTTNFEVKSPSPAAARAVAGEAEFQREAIAKEWLGKPLPKWDKPAAVIVMMGWNAGTGTTTLTFADAKSDGGVIAIEIRLDGFSLEMLEHSLPREMAHAVLATHFGKPVPRWADEGIAALYGSFDEQVKLDRATRQLLSAGRGLRLKSLFRMTEYPRDATLLTAQGTSVCRYLLATGNSRAKVLEFVSMGMKENTAESWDSAAQIVGLKSIDGLEADWLRWLENPKSQLLEPAGGQPASRPIEPQDHIPPVKLPGGANPIKP